MKKIRFSELCRFTDRQKEADRALKFFKFLLYGGALGGGKSYFLRWIGLKYLLKWAQMGLTDMPIMLACEDYPSLRDRQLVKINKEFPSWLGRLVGKHRVYGECFLLHPEYGSGAMCFRNLDDPSKYQSSEFAMILVDELTKNPLPMFNDLRHRLRWEGFHTLDCKFLGGTNPGGIGHGWVKALFVDKIYGPEWLPSHDDPIDYTKQFGFVKSKADDNPHLDASYWQMLRTLPTNLRKAFRDGDWSVFLGQAFPEFSKVIHVIDPVPIPDNAMIYMTYDWGYSAPFSILWWWVDGDDNIYLFDEWYGWTGTPNQGIRLVDSKIAEGIIYREYHMGLHEDDYRMIRLAGNDCFQIRPDYKEQGVEGKSTSDVFAEPHTVEVEAGKTVSKALFLTGADDRNRMAKIKQFRERLRYERDEKTGEITYGPKMKVYRKCEQFIRTISDLVMDKNNIEDADTKAEDHPYDSACHIAMARPISPMPKSTPKTVHQKRIDELTRGVDPDEAEHVHTAEIEHRAMMEDAIDYMYDHDEIDESMPINTVE